MVKRNKLLLESSVIADSRKTITYKDSYLKAIPANEHSAHGFDIHFLVGDELHAWPGRAMYDVLTTDGRQAPAAGDLDYHRWL